MKMLINVPKELEWLKDLEESTAKNADYTISDVRRITILANMGEVAVNVYIKYLFKKPQFAKYSFDGDVVKLLSYNVSNRLELNERTRKKLLNIEKGLRCLEH